MSQRFPRRQLHELPNDLADRLRRSTPPRVGHRGEFYEYAAHQPDALRSFMEFTAALHDALPHPLVEVVALTVAGIMENEYERHQYERRAVELGLPQGWVTAVDRLSPDKATELSAVERAVQRYALASVVRRGIGVKDEFEALLDHLSVPQAMAVALLVGCCVSQAIVSNTLALAPPVTSIFGRKGV